MPGLYGIVALSGNRDIKLRLSEMAASMERRICWPRETAVDSEGGWGLGRVHLGFLNSRPQLDGDARIKVLFHGDLHNAVELGRTLDLARNSADSVGSAMLLRALYERFGIASVSRLRGTFCAAILDQERQRVVLVNDLTGNYPLYWHLGTNYLVFASELKTVLRGAELKSALNSRAVADYLKFGFVLGTKTLATNVQVLASASTLTVDWRNGTHHLDRYNQISDVFQGWKGTRERYLDEVCERFNQAVATNLSDDQQYLLALSGGLDSRAILSAAKRSDKTLSSYTVGVKGCADEIIAQKLSVQLRTRHRFFNLEANFLGDFLPNLRQMVTLTDGMFMSHGLTEILALKGIEQEDHTVLLRGHCGELAKAGLAWPFHVDDVIAAMRGGAKQLIPYLLRRFDHVTHDGVMQELFTKEWLSDLEGQARRSLEESLTGLDLSAADACSYLYLEEHHRRFTVASLEVFRDLIEVRLPFVDQDFLFALFSGPAAWRTYPDIHKRLISGNDPALGRIRNANTGAPANAGFALEFVLDKFNSVLRKLNVRGYRHYHAYDAWVRNTFLKSVERELLAERCLDRGMVRREGIERLIQETYSGAFNNGSLLQILLILEFWQQESTFSNGGRTVSVR